MSTSEGFTDSTDWLKTPLSSIAPLDAALRCQVCKDFFTTPMITSCSHTFCSLCIRRYLSQEGRCPACRESDQEIKLRRNWSIEEAVIQFKAGRDDLLKVARSTQEESNNNTRPRKRRKIEHNVPLPERRSTRSQSRRQASQDTQNGYSIPSSQEEVQDSDEGSVYEISPAPKVTSEPHDGLVACPCCGKRMKETFINSHLDRCMAGEASPSPRRSDTPQTQQASTSIAYGQSKPSQTQDRLPTINYSLLNDNALRKKLKELGIPSHGSKELMRKRHTEWINLWNANCDSLRPISKQQLLRDLDRWEKTLGKQIDKGGPSGVMVKDFDRDGWQKSNKNDFDDLIKKAREKRSNHVKTNDEQQQQQQQEQNGYIEPHEAAESQAVQPVQTQPRDIGTIFDDVAARSQVLTNGHHDAQALNNGPRNAATLVLDDTDMVSATALHPGRMS